MAHSRAATELKVRLVGQPGVTSQPTGGTYKGSSAVDPFLCGFVSSYFIPIAFWVAHSTWLVLHIVFLGFNCPLFPFLPPVKQLLTCVWMSDMRGFVM